MATPRKMGAYLCRGCGIDARLDVDRLQQIADLEGKADFSKQHDFLCSKAGVDMIRADLESGDTDHVVICACSPRAKTEAFRFSNVAMTRANLREGVIWSQPEGEPARAATQEMAEDYVRMACVESRFVESPSASQQQSLNRTILVVGGGVSGLTAAREAAIAGYSVTVVESTDKLGGFAAKMHRRVPFRSPYAQPTATGIEALIAAVNGHEAIEVELSSRIAATSGAPGRFMVRIEHQNGHSRTDTFGAIIQATGFTAYDPAQLPELGYGASPDVVTQAELETLVRSTEDGVIRRPSNAAAVHSVVFIQCAGQRSDKVGELPYCSGHCCGTSIKQAMYFKDANPNVETTILYTDLRTPGVAGEDFYRSGQHQGIIFSKGIAQAVEVDNGKLTLVYQDLILNETVKQTLDMVVLATGMIPNSGVDPDRVVNPDSDRKQVTIAVDSILNLSYRQGSDLPQLSNGFADSHFICFPYETRRTGIYTAGPVRRPMDMFQACEDATGAAMKAVQAVENAGRGRAAHPRAGDLSFPRVRYDGCTQCKRCTVECPFGAIDEDEKGYPIVNESRCRRCGTCMGACPVRVISFENYSIDSIGQQIKHVDVPDESEDKPRILVLACENDAYPALDMAAMNRVHWSPYARIIPIRCLGSINAIWITDALNSGFDGVVMMGCKSGEDYQCHFVKGSEIGQERMTKIDDTLVQLGLEKERIATYEVAITDIARAPRLINDMADTIANIGLSPLKL